MEKKFKSIFLEWIETISMHGLANLFRKKILTIRIIWIFAFFVSNATCFYIISMILGNFLNYDVITKIRIKKKDSLIFPAVTVCNFNAFTTEFDLNYVNSYLENNSLKDFPYSTKINQIVQNKSDIFFNHQMARFFSVVGYKYSLIKNIIIINESEIYERMFISCLFSTRPCDKRQWKWFYDPIYGSCFTFNGKNTKELLKANQPGKFFGLILELNVGVPNDIRTLSIGSGAHVYINDNLIQPLFGDGFDISPGTFSNILLERISNKQMPKPYSECLENLNSIESFDSEYYRKVFKSNLTYRQIDCFNAYIHSQILSKCYCNDLRFNIAAESEIMCQTFVEQKCSFETIQKVAQSNYHNEIEKFCPLECESIIYNTKFSFSKYPSQSYGKSLSQQENIQYLLNKSNISLEDLRENIVGINVYYETLKQTEITENKSISWDGLVGSIGGTLGLFLGMSVLSFVDFIDLFCQIIFNYKSKIKTKVDDLNK